MAGGLNGMSNPLCKFVGAKPEIIPLCQVGRYKPLYVY